MTPHRHGRGPRRRRRRLDPDANYGVQAGWFATLDDLDEAKRLAHDQLIASMGATRTGPVSWRYWSGQDASDTLAELRKGEPPGAAPEYAMIAELLREHGGFLILAMARGAD